MHRFIVFWPGQIQLKKTTEKKNSLRFGAAQGRWGKAGVSDNVCLFLVFPEDCHAPFPSFEDTPHGFQAAVFFPSFIDISPDKVASRVIPRAPNPLL